MLKVYYCDVSDFTVTEKMKSYFSDIRLKKLNKSKNKTLSAGTEALLCYAIGEKPSYAYSESGKPYFLNKDLYFSLSHSGNWVSCAISNSPVGVDIQQIRAFKDSVAKRLFTEEEYRLLRACQNREEFFCSVWVKKEAAAKKTGLGLSGIFKGIESDACLLRTNDYFIAVSGSGEAEFIEVRVSDLEDFFERI